MSRRNPDRSRGQAAYRTGIATAFVCAVFSASACSQGRAWEDCPATPAQHLPAPRMTDGPALREGRNGPVLHWRGRDRVLIGHSLTQAWMELGDDFDEERYLDDLHAAGINSLLLWSFIGSSAATRGRDARIGYRSQARWPWQGSPDAADVDVTQFNDKYFTALQRLAREASARDIVMIVVVHDGWTKDRFAYHPFNAAVGNGPLESRGQYVELARYGCPAPVEPQDAGPGLERALRNQLAQEAFADALIDTLAAQDNVLFEMFNEGEWYAPGARALHERHFIKYFRARGAATMSNIDHIIAFDPRRDPLPELISIHKPKVDSGLDPADIFAQVAAFARYGRPVVFSETVPALGRGNYPRARLLELIWATLFARGHVVVQDDTAFRYSDRAGAGKKAADGEWLLRVLAVANGFERALPLAGLQPAPLECSTGVCAQLDEGTLAGFSATAAPVSVARSGRSGAAVRWLNAETGAWKEGATEPGAEFIVLRPPFAPAIFVLEAPR